MLLNHQIIIFAIIFASSRIRLGLGLQGNFRQLSKCDANFTLTALIALHNHDADTAQGIATEACGGKLQPRRLYEAIAVIYALLKVNEDNTLLPGISLAVDIIDICNSLGVAIQSYLGLDFVSAMYRSSASNGWSELHGEKPGPTFAIIGTGNTKIANSLSTLSNLFNVPVISYTATSPLLSNENRFKSFFRTLPSDELLADMILELLAKFNWNLVSAIRSGTDYALSAFGVFHNKLQEAKKNKAHSNLCLGHVEKFTDDNNQTDKMFTKNAGFAKSKVVVVFAHSYDAEKILLRALERNATDKVWILTDSSTTNKQFCDDKWKPLSGKIIITGFKNYQDTQFAEFIVNNVIETMDPGLAEIIPAVKEVKDYMGSNFHGNITLKAPWTVSYVIDAVNAAAHALHIALNCSSKRCVVKKDEYKQRDLLNSMFKVNVTSQLGHPVLFDKHGDTSGWYVLHSILIENNECSFSKFGEWRGSGSPSGFLQLDESMARKHKSRCNSCPDGWGRSLKKAGGCCWPCEKCTGDAYKSNSTKLCEKCPVDSVPDEEHTECIALIRRYPSLTSNNLCIAVLTMSAIGLMLVVLILCVFFKYRDTHLVRASNKELTAVLLCGIALGYTTPLISVMAQKTWLCQLYVYTNGLSFSLMLGALFTKVNRISRIFRKQVMRTGQLKYMTVKWQMLFISIFVVMEMVLVSLVVFQSGDTVKVISIKTQQYIDSFCYIKFEMLAVLWSFKGALVILCTHQAFLSRNVPYEYSESRSIFLVMLLITLQTLGCMATLFYGGGVIDPVLVSMPEYLTATTVTAVIFGYKIYVILFKPDQNKAPMPHGSLGTFLPTRRKRRRTINQGELANDTNIQTANTGVVNIAFNGDLKE